MTVGDLKAALALLPDDMPVACTSTHLTSGMAAAVVRYHFAAREGMKRYADGLWIGWAGDYYHYDILPNGVVRSRANGYQPELQTVLHDDGAEQPHWKLTEEPGR